jgi:purine-binding chemotaxis protein CheW
MNQKKDLETALDGLFSPQNEPPAADSPPELPAPTSTPVTEQIEEAEGVEGSVAVLVEEQAVASSPQSEGMAPWSKESEATDQREEQIVAFTLAGEQYGVDISTVNSIIKMQYITAIPRAPRFIEGVTNLRGIVLPVVDLRKRLGMPPAEDDKDARIIVVETRDTMIGIIVDAVTEVLRIPISDIEPPSPIVTTVDGNAASLARGRNAFITGVAKVHEEKEGGFGRLIVLLDLEAALTTEEVKPL